jgi:hypothetical protein
VDVDMQLNTCIHNFKAAALDIKYHHDIINHKHVLDKKKIPIYDFNYKILLQTEGPAISTWYFPHGRLLSSSDTLHWSEQVKYRKPGSLGT